MRVGTWLTRSALFSPRETAQRLAEVGIEHASIMLNDYGGARSARPFETHDPQRIVTLAVALRDVGLAVSLTTWIMPHREFLDGLLEEVPDLLERCGAEMVALDAEEPWTKAIEPIDRGEAAYMLSAIPVRRCLSGIAYVNAEALEPLAEICNVYSPQAYVTTRPGSLRPDRAIDVALSRWRAAFSEPESWMVGLACYAQPIPARAMMTPVLEHARAAGIGDVCYWSHRRILERSDVAAVISGIDDAANGDPSRADGIMPELDVEAMPSDVADDRIGQLQSLLAWASARSGDESIHPGKLDGKPGLNTAVALDAFNARARVPAPPGVATGQTWWELLRG